ncbi:MAG: DnaJ domain-containing protein [Gammaproteobacteria bacterium]|nr:DnaJ domain-containing protein [Gammaproteobacteria bacterium]PIQ37378.1 MAG: hypothetical protein COW59_07500 [Xanthomonadales bacterium CG17_big_fil_post_rev_8_21_14_2_50_64_11]PIX60355.1 MAG: hypothetical protein COZ47_07690 [Xanthomonadales bacterium CG_4_10_14_3_um_filter_64_11]
MSAVPGPALELALALFQTPLRLAGARDRPLPEGTEQLLRLLVAAESEREAIAGKLQIAPAHLHEACVFFVTELLFAPTADSYRILGLRPDCAQAQIKEHYRLLMRWLHPDRDAHDWHSVHAPRINRAASDLRAPAVRRAYDATRKALNPVARGAHDIAWRPNAVYEPLPAPGPRAWAAHLPALVVGLGMALLTLLLLALWHARSPGTGSAASLVTDAPAVGANNAVIFAQPRPPSLAASMAGVETLASPAAPLAVARAVVDPVVAERTGVASNRAQRPARTRPVPSTPSPAGVATPALPKAPVPVPEILTATAPPAVAVGTDIPTTEPDSAAAPDLDPVGSDGIERGVAGNKVSVGLDDATALLVAFVDRYAAGDLPGLLSLFADDARIERGGLAAIAEDYGQLFRDSSDRRLALSNMQWQHPPDGWVAEGRFVASVASEQFASVRQVAGSIRFTLRADAPGLRIVRLEHRIDP